MNDDPKASPLEQLLRFIATHTYRRTRVDVAATGTAYFVAELSRDAHGFISFDELRQLLATPSELGVGLFSDGLPVEDGYVRQLRWREFRCFLIRPSAGGAEVLQATRNVAGIRIGRVPRALLGADKDAIPMGRYFGHQDLYLSPPFR